jgi:hypothetical protein
VIKRKGEGTHDKLSEDGGVGVDGDDVEQEFDFILFDLAEVVCAYKEAGVEWREEVLY